MKDSPVMYPRPGPGTRTGRVWEVADEITRETGRRAARAEVIDRIVAEQGNPATANTQYQYWKFAYDTGNRPARPGATAKLHDAGEQALRIGRDGRVVVPEAMREAMLLNDEGRVTAHVEDGELRMVSRTVAIRRMQLEAQGCKAAGASVVDEFLSRRREMWGEE